MLILPKPVPDDGQTFLWLIVGVFSAWGGVVRYLMDSQTSGKHWSWSGVLSQVVISGFTGFLGGFYGYEQNYSQLMTLALAGISGSLGSELLRWLWQRVFQIRGKK
ncbi:phage holin family protein [Serratia quinivorans]|uniref:phage holin family protein n=1 Tax=Serratia quinivorans TaxID=137545 RepID=UPI002179B7DB|nr:phage holin family protein [Serratia quinivorans]CAI1221181.1 Uncharacterised protein [Serratia quinivorans]CAI1659290.1 Uncharacterised protein [Serratia quinivorans]CAI2005978.1 Uncharacterised protein [Serratia quinivorans]